MASATVGSWLSDVDWTAVAAVATAVAAGVTAWMAWMTRKMATHAGSQASTARAALEDAQRPIVVTTARTARLPNWHSDAAPQAIREQDGKYFVPLQNIGPGAALNVNGVLMWQLVDEEDDEQYDVTTTMCVSPHPQQLAPGAHALLEFRPLNPEPISAPDAALRFWYTSASGEAYWTAERLSSEDPGYRSVTGRGAMPTDINERGAVPEQFAQHLKKLRRESLAQKFGSRAPHDRGDTEPSDRSDA
jgi:hypothetical protein